MLKKFYLLVLTLVSIFSGSLTAASLAKKTIMIDPAGHAKDTGRKLSQSYERAQTYAQAEELKTILENRYNAHVIITRAPGEEIVPLQNASFANRLNVDLFVRLHMYKKKTEKPKISVHRLVFDPISDYTKQHASQLSFIPVSQAHCKNITTTKDYAKKIFAGISEPTNQKLFDSALAPALPIKPLVGIIAPAIVLELGIHDDLQWRLSTEPIAQSIASALLP